jgi:hypothetical protein
VHIVLSPSGGDDTAQIQDAFDLAYGRPGSTVELTAGVFTLYGPILAVNFDGTFKGAGKCRTTITTPDKPYVFPLPDVPFFPAAAMFLFWQDETWDPTYPNKITYSDMTVHGRCLAEEWFGFDSIAVLITHLGIITGTPDPAVTRLSTCVKRMHFEGEVHAESFFGYSVFNGFYIQAGPGSTGTHTLTRCSFEKITWGNTYEWLTDSTVTIRKCSFDTGYNGIWFGFHTNTKVTVDKCSFTDILTGIIGYENTGSTYRVKRSTFTDIWEGLWFEYSYDCNIIVGGKPCYKNTFTNAETSAVNIFASSNTMVEFSYCKTYDCSGFWAFQPYYMDEAQWWQEDYSASKFYIHHNTINMVESPMGRAGVELWDEVNDISGEPGMRVLIYCNTFVSEGRTAPFGPIFGWAVDRAFVFCNKIKGSGDYAICVGWPDFTQTNPCSKWFIICNNLKCFDENIADIYLSEYSERCLVIGSCKDTVHDLGTDNHIFGPTVI